MNDPIAALAQIQQNCIALIQGRLPVQYSRWTIDGSVRDVPTKLHTLAGVFPAPCSHNTGYSAFPISDSVAMTADEVRAAILNAAVRPDIISQQEELMKEWQTNPLIDQVLETLAELAHKLAIPLVCAIFGVIVETGEKVMLICHHPTMPTSIALAMLQQRVLLANVQNPIR